MQFGIMELLFTQCVHTRTLMNDRIARRSLSSHGFIRSHGNKSCGCSGIIKLNAFNLTLINALML